MIRKVRQWAVALLLPLLCSVVQSAEILQHQADVQVVSINVCTDQLVLLLADPEQVLALSSLSTDAAGSYFHERAQAFSQADPTAEDLVPLSPDIVITGPYTSRYTLKLLEELQIRVETLPIAASLEEMFANVRRMGELLGHNERAERIISQLGHRLDAVHEQVSRQTEERPKLAVYDANGYTVGGQTVRGDIISRAGWHNVAVDRNIDSYGVLGLEDLIALKPQALMESPYSSDTYSRGQALTHHPAIRASGLDPMIIPVPSNQTICAGPWAVDVVEQLFEARDSLVAHP